MQFLGSFLFTILLAVTAAKERPLTGEERLFHQLMRNYVTRARPATNASEVTSVSLGLDLLRIADFDDVRKVVKVNAWLSVIWNDFRLKWDPTNFDGVTQMHLKQTDIWLPDLMLYNGAKPDMEVGNSPVVIDSHGQVIWIAPVLMEFPCTSDHAGSKVNCRARIGSWTYDGNQVDLVNERLDLSSLIQNPLFNVSEPSAQRNSVYYPCCKEPYVDVTFSFDISFLF